MITNIKKMFMKYILIILLLLISIMIGITAGVIAGSLQDVPSLDQMGTWLPSESTVIYSSDGEIISQLYSEERRVMISLSDIPTELINAIIAIEDTNFYYHQGIDPWGLMRAVWVRVTEGKIQGGSTLTQQLAKNAFLTHDQTIYRKIQDMFLALQLERRYTKNEILEFYLNQVYFGHGAYGVETAANIYFDKKAKELNLAESALLAGVINGPYYFSPYINIEAAKQRRDVVLNRMQELDLITQETAENAKNESIELVGLNADIDSHNSYFVNYIRDYLLNRYGSDAVYRGGFKVYTTLDLEMQKAAEEVLKEKIPVQKKDDNELRQPQGSLITLDPNTGHVLTMVGGLGDDHFNRAIQSYRQPGSALKPFIYAAALENDFNPGDGLNDTPLEFPVEIDGEEQIWSPRNYTNIHRGPTSLRVGLSESINTLAVKLFYEIGVEHGIEYLKKFGISSLITDTNQTQNDLNLSTALGGLTKGVTPLELAASFAPFAAQGIKTEPVTILRIEDRFGNTVEEHSPQRNVVLDKRINYLMVDMLKTVINEGTGKRADINRPMGGKTGTTNNYTDAWFVGFTPNYVSAVWIGEDNPQPMTYNGTSISSGAAAEIWREYMSQILYDKPVFDFDIPEGLSTREVCSLSGMLPNEYCRETVEEIFLTNNLPDDECELHKKVIEVRICTDEWTLASDSCPSEKVVTKYFQEDTGVMVNKDGLPMTSFLKQIYPQPSEEEYKEMINEYILPEDECDIHQEENNLWRWFWNR